MMFRNFAVLGLVCLFAITNADPVPKPKLKGLTVQVSNVLFFIILHN